MQTRGDETIGTHAGINIVNEAVGGNGIKMDAYITCAETSLSGGMKCALAYFFTGEYIPHSGAASG